MKKISAIVVIALMALSCKPAAPEGGLRHVSPESVGMNSEKLAQIDREANAAIAEGTVPGCVISVVKGDKIVFLKAYGNQQVVPDTIPMSTNTIFDLASVSKCVGTTTSIMQLLENGYCRLTDEVDMYIPDYKPWTDPETGKKVDITIQDLMTHVSGVDSYINVPRFVERFGENQPDSLIKFIATETGRNFRPKTDYTYSCLNFVSLQNVLQNITGEKLCDYAQKHIFDVLGMKHTCYRPKETRPDLMPLVAPTEVQADGKPLWGEVHDPIARRCNAGNSGNAGVFSNCEDLSVFCAAIMNGGAVNGKRILSPLAIETMVTVPSDNDPAIGRALGWDNRSESAGLRGDFFSRTRTICHTGYTGTSVIMDMDNKVAVIVLAHRVHPVDAGGTGKLRARVANIVAGSIEK